MILLGDTLLVWIHSERQSISRLWCKTVSNILGKKIVFVDGRNFHKLSASFKNNPVRETRPLLLFCIVHPPTKYDYKCFDHYICGSLWYQNTVLFAFYNTSVLSVFLSVFYYKGRALWPNWVITIPIYLLELSILLPNLEPEVCLVKTIEGDGLRINVF